MLRRFVRHAEVRRKELLLLPTLVTSVRTRVVGGTAQRGVRLFKGAEPEREHAVQLGMLHIVLLFKPFRRCVSLRAVLERARGQIGNAGADLREQLAVAHFERRVRQGQQKVRHACEPGDFGHRVRAVPPRLQGLRGVHVVAALRVELVVLVEEAHVLADRGKRLLREPGVVLRVGVVVKQHQRHLELAHPFVLVPAAVLKLVGTVLPFIFRPIDIREMVTPGHDAFGNVRAAVSEILARALHVEIKKPHMHAEERLEHLAVAGGAHRVVRQTRVLPPVAVAPATVVGVAVLGSGENRTVEADGVRARSGAGRCVPLRGPCARDGGTGRRRGDRRVGKISRMELSVKVHLHLAVGGYAHRHGHVAPGRHRRRMVDGLLGDEQTKPAAEDVHERPVGAARRDVVDDALVAAHVLCVERRDEDEPVLVDARGGRYFEHACELRIALAVAPDRDGQLGVVGEVETGAGRPPCRRRDRDVAAVPECAPGRFVRGTLRRLGVERTAVAVEQLVRAAQPFRLVLARMIARDCGEEERSCGCAG